MIFNSLEFGIFLPVVFLLYWFVANRKPEHQNFLLLLSSYVFYGWWDIRFLVLMIFSSLIDYFFSLKISSTENLRRKKILLFTCLSINLSFLCFFKYFNFFIRSFSEAFTLFGQHIEPWQLSIVLPVGISFYTFQTMSYTIDVYAGRITPVKKIISYLCYVSFFPQLVAGPIERASALLPQFNLRRSFNYAKATDGMRQMLWGFFKKLVIADNCANIVNRIFDNPAHLSGSTLLLGAFLFSFQIYGDFSGYSDIAIGSARLFGFDLSKNFNYPFFARSIPEFWRRWHMTLTNWFRDYVFIPLSSGKRTKLKQIRNIFILFILVGFWHGANWTFIFYGLLQGIFFLPSILLKKQNPSAFLAGINSFFVRMITERMMIFKTFLLTMLAGVFFRASNISQAVIYFKKMFSRSLFSRPAYLYNWTILTLVFILILLIVEWKQKEKPHGLDLSGARLTTISCYSIYILIALVIIGFKGPKTDFIYLQF